MGQPVAYPGGLVTAGFAASGRMAYVAHSKGVELWNARTGERVGSGVNAHFPVYAAAVSPDGTRAVINSVIPPSPMPERALHLFDTRTGREIPQLPHIDWAVFAAFSPDGRRLLSMERVGMHFARFHVWDLASGRDLFPPIRTSSSLNCPPGFGTAPGVFSPDGHRVALVGSRRFAVFDTESGTRLAGKGPPYDDEDSSADGLAFSADGKWIVCIDNRLGTSLCDAATAKPRADMAYVPDAIYSFSISADATRIACSYRVGRGVNDVVTATGIFDLLTGKLLHRLGDAEDGIPALSPSGDRLAVTGTGTRKDETTVWRLLEAK
jgi:WD40 repeat protein